MMSTPDQRGRFILLLFVISSFPSFFRTAGAGDEKAVQNEQVVKANPAPDPILPEKMRMRRVISIANSRIELVPVDWNDDELDEDSRHLTHFRLADESFFQLVFGKAVNADDARAQAAGALRERISVIDQICGLTDSQIRKLEIAGRGDIKRLLDLVEKERQKFENHLASDVNFEQIMALERDLLNATGPLCQKFHSDIYDSESMFAKTLRQVLTHEQVPGVQSNEPVLQVQPESPTSGPAVRASGPRKWGRVGRKTGIGFGKKITIHLNDKRIVVDNKQHVLTVARADSTDEVIDQVLASVDTVADSWGEPPSNFYWAPAVQFIVYPRGDANYSALQKVLEQTWGVTSTVEYAAERKDRKAAIPD
ncbi:MAG: hypothetical protein JSS02_33680 [Planctomycetes bacterium]|nr:hypothetical protein [Planctomycetota bacterium]